MPFVEIYMALFQPQGPPQPRDSTMAQTYGPVGQTGPQHQTPLDIKERPILLMPLSWDGSIAQRDRQFQSVPLQWPPMIPPTKTLA